MTTNFRVKMAKSADSPFIVLAFLNEVEYRNSGFSRFIYDDLAVSYISTSWRTIVYIS